MDMVDFSKLTYYRKSLQERTPVDVTADLCIYGGTPAGIAAAVQASRMGLRTVIAEFGSHIGGISASGLGRTDFGNKSAIGGISLEFYQELGRRYGGGEAVWYFEPHLAKNIFHDWLERDGVDVYFEQQLKQVEKQNGRITRIMMENGNTFSAAMYIDATYEGDLLARAGVSYHVGRESNATYRETLNGIHFGHPNHNFKAWVDPYVIEGKPDSGLLPGIMDASPGIQGQGDRSVQAYNFRICLTNIPDNRLPIPEPPNYDPQMFALLGRYLRAGIWDAMQLHKMMPNGKTDLNNYGAVSTDFIGANHEWPDGSHEVREAIFQKHVQYNMGLLYYLTHDEQVPGAIRSEVAQWGLPADEFQTTANWPHQLYVREGRRMISEVVLTELHCRRLQVEQDSVGLASYQMDSHNCRRIVIDGRCINEGNVEVKPDDPYPISYRAIVPRGEECMNLLVPVCLSASHIAYGSVRMEPVFMILGQSAGTAAALALQSNCAVQEINYDQLKHQLLSDKQILA